ncbi:MAG: putative transposase [Halioglobus sp.]|jgi:putative transposase
MELPLRGSSGDLLRSHGGEPKKIVTDKLRSYGVAQRELMPETVHSTAQYENNLAEQSHETTRVAYRELIPETIHSTKQYENNRAAQSHEATRVRERGKRKFKSVRRAQRFLGARAAVSNLFNLGRHLVGAAHYRNLRISAFTE